jgi:hypothetical protein
MRINDDDDIEISQNLVLSAFLLHEFALSFSEKKQSPIDFLYFLPVLPLVYDSTMAEKIFNKANKINSMVKLIQENEGYISEMDSHVKSYFKRSCNTLRLANDLNFVVIKNLQIHPIKLRNKPPKTEYRDVWRMSLAAKRLGYWFSQLSIHELYTLLNIEIL